MPEVDGENSSLNTEEQPKKKKKKKKPKKNQIPEYAPFEVKSMKTVSKPLDGKVVELIGIGEKFYVLREGERHNLYDIKSQELMFKLPFIGKITIMVGDHRITAFPQWDRIESLPDVFTCYPRLGGIEKLKFVEPLSEEAYQNLKAMVKIDYLAIDDDENVICTESRREDR